MRSRGVNNRCPLCRFEPFFDMTPEETTSMTARLMQGIVDLVSTDDDDDEEESGDYATDWEIAERGLLMEALERNILGQAINWAQHVVQLERHLPHILSNVADAATLLEEVQMWSEETLGYAAATTTFDDLRDVVNEANSTLQNRYSGRWSSSYEQRRDVYNELCDRRRDLLRASRDVENLLVRSQGRLEHLGDQGTLTTEDEDIVSHLRQAWDDLLPRVRSVSDWMPGTPVGEQRLRLTEVFERVLALNKEVTDRQKRIQSATIQTQRDRLRMDASPDMKRKVVAALSARGVDLDSIREVLGEFARPLRGGVVEPAREQKQEQQEPMCLPPGVGGALLRDVYGPRV